MPNDAFPDGYLEEVGKLLKQGRENQSLDETEIAIKIALSGGQILAVEQAETDRFYNKNYHLQAIRRYAEFLKIQLPSLEEFLSKQGEQEKKGAPPSP